MNGMAQLVVRLVGGTTGFVTVDNARTSSPHGPGSLDVPFEGEVGSGSMRRLGNVRASFAG